MPLYEFEGKRPLVHPSTYISPEAVIIGDGEIGADCYIGPGAVIRGDFGAIRIGNESNVQDNCVVHGRPDAVTVIGDRVSLAHGAIVHCCTIDDDALVGMRACVSDWARIGRFAVVAEGAVVVNQMEVEPETIVGGVPAKPIGKLDRKAREYMLGTRMMYVQMARRQIRSLRPVSAPAPAAPQRGLISEDGCVLVVVDMQEKLYRRMHHKERLLAGVLRLIRFARAAEIPLVVTEQYPKGLGRTIPEVTRELPEDQEVIEKVAFGCFGEERFQQRLAELGARTLVVCGIEAHICVGQTVLAAPEQMQVYLVVDAVSAHTSLDVETAVARARAAGVIPVTVEMFMFEYLKVAKTEKFERCLEVLRRE